MLEFAIWREAGHNYTAHVLSKYAVRGDWTAATNICEPFHMRLSILRAEHVDRFLRFGLSEELAGGS